MDDSLFLPPDIMKCYDPKDTFNSLSSHLRKLDTECSQYFSNPNEYQNYKKTLDKLLRDLHISLDRPENILMETPVEKVSNIVMNVRPILEELDDFVSSRMLNWSLDVKSLHLIFGLTRNLHQYIVTQYNLTRDQIRATEQRGKFFLYNTRTHSLSIFNKDLLPVMLRQLLFNGEKVDLFYLFQRIKAILK